jgi:hypothetical protein
MTEEKLSTRVNRECHSCGSDVGWSKLLIEMDNLEARLVKAQTILLQFPTLEQATTIKAKELGINEEWLAPDGMAETKYYELVEEWKSRLESTLGVMK